MTSPYTDPVCGMRVESDKISTLHEGTRHVFCSTHCQQKFAANPPAYLKPQTKVADKGAKPGCCG